MRVEYLHEVGIVMGTPDLQLLQPNTISTLSLFYTEQSYTWDAFTDSNGNIVNTLTQSSA